MRFAQNRAMSYDCAEAQQMLTETETQAWMAGVVEKRFEQTQDDVHHWAQDVETRRLHFALNGAGGTTE